MTNSNNIASADIYLNEQSIPVSNTYCDVYFSKANGAQETDYVFIQANELHAQWMNHASEHYCIAETGFGSGLNFFRCVQHFLYFRRTHPNHILTTLNFISTEKHPLKKQDAVTILQHWQNDNFLDYPAHPSTNIYELTQQWLAQYPHALAGIHRRPFVIPSETCQTHVLLDIHYGDAAVSLAQIEQTPNGVVDAWFLDGFAPSKNDSMWTQTLYEQMARLSKANATFATFTAAGAVKRGLQSAGFTVVKQKGFGHKREMLTGIFDKAVSGISTKKSPLHAPYFARTHTHITHNNAPVMVVGNGLAGALLALKLTQRGKHVDLFWQGSVSSDGASGNPIGGFYPQLNAQHNVASQLQLHSFLYASEFYTSLNILHPFKHEWCGALQIGFNENMRARLLKMKNANLWPQEIAHLLGAQEAASIANIPIPYPCLHIPKAGWIEPPDVVNACLALAQKTGLLTLHNHMRLCDYKCAENSDIQVRFSNTLCNEMQMLHAKTLVLAMGSGSQGISKHVIPLRLTRGQVEMVSNTPAQENEHDLTHLNTLLCHKGYFTPAVGGFHALGSSYVKNDENCDVRIEETNSNFDMHINSIDSPAWQSELKGLRNNPDNYARAATRCSSPDHLPVVGAMPSQTQFNELAHLYKALPLGNYPIPNNDKGVFILTGLGSRGLTTAPLMAETLVSQMLGQPMAMAKPLLDAIVPNRFIVRSLIRKEQWQT